MLLTLALSGMDSATETALRAAFAGANTRLGECCALVPESESQHVIVDMDSMYGPMSWLRLHAAGKQVIGLTSAPRVQTHFRLARPFDDQAMVALLREVADSLGVSLPAPAAESVAPSPAVEAPAQQPPVSDADTAPPNVAAPGSPSAHEAPEAPPAPVTVASPDAGIHVPLTAFSAPPANAPEAPEPPAPSEPAPARERSLADWLARGVLQGRHRYRGPAGPTLLIDFDAQDYRGPTLLKPLVQYFEGPVERDAFEPLDDAAWTHETAAAGNAQPLLRLRWLGALLAGDGSLASGYDPDARYSLNKWPQTEREYPRHFRIATAMMKGPATLDEIVVASGLPADEVYRFVNANLATGYAEPVVETPPETPDSAKSSGFLSRLRRR